MKSWKDIQNTEAQAFSRGEFQGMVMQALKDMQDDIRDIKQQNNITRYISMGAGALSGIIGAIIGTKIGK